LLAWGVFHVRQAGAAVGARRGCAAGYAGVLPAGSAHLDRGCVHAKGARLWSDGKYLGHGAVVAGLFARNPRWWLGLGNLEQSQSSRPFWNESGQNPAAKNGRPNRTDCATPPFAEGGVDDAIGGLLFREFAGEESVN